MAAESSSVQFKKIIASVQAKISYQKAKRLNRTILLVAAKVFLGNNNEERKNKIAVLKARRKNCCILYGKAGHNANKCWYRTNSTHGGRGRIRRRRFARDSRRSRLAFYCNFKGRSNFILTVGQDSWDVLPHKDVNPLLFEAGQKNGILSVKN